MPCLIDSETFRYGTTLDEMIKSNEPIAVTLDLLVRSNAPRE